jgi:methane/ammonia monooxygenase subunit C
MAQSSAVAARVAERAEWAEKTFTFAPAIKMLGGLSVFYIIVRIYQQEMSWKYGLDFFAPEFTTYWLSILYIELPTWVIIGTVWWGYLWKTRDRAVDKITPQEELKRYWFLLQMVMLYAWAVYWGASFFTEQDGTWHQTVIRDTDFTPSHIIEFYMSYPIYILIGVATYLYAKTRLPLFSKGHSLSYLMLVGGPAMIFVNVALNEWGHTFWIMEELFVAPLHWGFVTLGWFGLAVWGVFLTACPRILELTRSTLPSRSAA